MQPQKLPGDGEYVDGWSVMTDRAHALQVVEVSWCEDECIRIRIPKGAPSAITGAYLEGGNGDDIEIKIAKRTERRERG
jgi:hypothetical protein